jgi:hypothetical protein
MARLTATSTSAGDDLLEYELSGDVFFSTRRQRVSAGEREWREGK